VSRDMYRDRMVAVDDDRPMRSGTMVLEGPLPRSCTQGHWEEVRSVRKVRALTSSCSCISLNIMSPPTASSTSSSGVQMKTGKVNDGRHVTCILGPLFRNRWN